MNSLHAHLQQLTSSCASPAGEWWVELLRFYSSKELRLLAKAADARLHLPPDFQLSYELLRGMAHEHVRLRQVKGEWPAEA
jgi:hypothetical protein